jgi:Aerotolerance regulator N-terminal/von Willebrand factor type A domain
VTFLSPLFLVGSLAAAVPIVLHLLKREPEQRVKFGPVKLLRRAPVEDTQKHRLRELLLLALRVATFVLLAIAFARPFVASGAALGRSGVTVVALDISYSMDAPGRFDRARQLARDAIVRASAGDRVGVVAFADDGDVLVRPSADRLLATSAIDRASPGFGATRYRAGLSTAVQAIAGAGGESSATIVLVTDLQEAGWDAGDRVAIPDNVQIELADVGPVPSNAAVIAVRALADRVVATVRNASTQTRDIRAHLTIDGRAAGEATAALGPNQNGDVTFAVTPRGEAAAVSVDDSQGLSADNIRYAVLSGSSRPSVLVVGGSGNLSRDAYYLEHALGVGQAGGRGYDVSAMSGAQLSSDTATTGAPSAVDDRLSGRAAVVLVSTRGLERRGRELLSAYVQNGGGLLVAAGPEVDGEVAADVLGRATSLTIVNPTAKKNAGTLAPADPRHPIFRPFPGNSTTLGLVRFQEAARIDGAGCQTLARFTTGGNALLECPAGDGRALVLASDLNNQWNDFPLHASFVPFLHETVRYLASAHRIASDYIVGAAPAGVPRQPGVHVVPATAGSNPRRVTVNVDPRESDPGRLSAEEFQGAVTRLKGSATATARIEDRQREDDQRLWQYALALMIIMLAVEGVVAGRTS